MSITRMSGEKLYIAVGDVVVTVVVWRASNGLMRLGIDAPKEVGIWREEIAPEDVLEKLGSQNQKGGV